MTRRYRPLLVLAPSLLLACGGGNPEPATPAGGAAAEAPASSEPAPAPSDSKAGGDGWEGESEAKEGAAAAPANTGKPAPVEQQREETRTLEVIQKIVKDNRKPVRECYEKARKDLPSLQGDMIIHFILDPDGKVKKIEVNQARSTLKSPAVADCAIKVITGLTFPPSSRGMETTVNYPYNFTP